MESLISLQIQVVPFAHLSDDMGKVSLPYLIQEIQIGNCFMQETKSNEYVQGVNDGRRTNWGE